MKAFNGYDEAKKAAQYTGAEKLPVGAYICEIKNVRFESLDWGDVITVAFDVAEGDQKGFFAKQYEANTSEDKKWKGTTRVIVPKDDGSEKDGWTKAAFARVVDSLEKSNNGYIWDWDENKWKSKKVGIVFGETGTVIDGKEVVYTEAHGFCSIDDVKNDTFYKKLLDLRKKNGFTGAGNNSSSNSSTGFMAVSDSPEEEIPF